MKAKVYKSKSYTVEAVELTIPMSAKNEAGEDVTYQPGDLLVTYPDGTQGLSTKEEMLADFDEVVPRTRKPAETPAQ